MMTVHLFVAIGSFIIAIVCLLDSFITDSDKELMVAVVAMIVTIVLTIFYAVGCNKMSEQSWVYPDEPYAVEKLVALNDNNMMNGRFYVRSGYIESDLWYQYIYESQWGGYKTNKIKADSATIFYADDNYRVEWYERTRGWLYFTETDICHKIYIPEGSLTNTYSIDLQ